jgi:serine/threonine protein kinase
MKRISHEILIMAKSHHLSNTAIEREMESLNTLLDSFESPENFCHAHELVNRNSITQRKNKILKAIKYQELRPFRFLICKN